MAIYKYLLYNFDWWDFILVEFEVDGDFVRVIVQNPIAGGFDEYTNNAGRDSLRISGVVNTFYISDNEEIDRFLTCLENLLHSSALIAEQVET